MLRNAQNILAIVQLLAHCLATSALLPMELYEIAHSHPDTDHPQQAASLHEVLVAKEHFQERSHPATWAGASKDQPQPGFLLAHETPQPSRRHRKSSGASSTRRRSNQAQRNDRQGRQMVSHEYGEGALSPAEPKILYGGATSSEAGLPICAPNAVCSKINVYDVPFIERQCICPQQTTGAPLIYQYNTDSRSAILQKHLDKLQRNNRPQHILDYQAVSGPIDEQAYINELMRKLISAYDVPEIILENTHGGRLLRKRAKLSAGIRDMDNVITDKVPAKKRHNHRPEVPKMGGCSALVGRGDGHTIVDRTTQYKFCDPVNRLPECENFAYTWSVRMNTNTNVTEQIIHCRCRKNSVAYLRQRENFPDGSGFEYLFACSPQMDFRCQRKAPCQLFSVRHRHEVDEVTTHPLCSCPRDHSCPKHHTDAGVIGSTNYTKDNVMTYTAYCLATETSDS